MSKYPHKQVLLAIWLSTDLQMDENEKPEEVKTDGRTDRDTTGQSCVVRERISILVTHGQKGEFDAICTRLICRAEILSGNEILMRTGTSVLPKFHSFCQESPATSLKIYWTQQGTSAPQGFSFCRLCFLRAWSWRCYFLLSA